MSWPDPDREVLDIVARELERQNTTIQLIASENFVSPWVLSVTGSVLTNKYSEGYPGRRYYGGNVFIDQAEDLARRRICALLGADHANVQPHSGANANLGVYLALLEPGDKVMGMSLDHGGHLTHGSPVNVSGRLYDFVAYGVSPGDETIDYDRVRELALAERAEDDRGRRYRLPAHHRPRTARRDRHGNRGPVPLRRCAHRWADHRRCSSEPRSARGRRDVHDPQDASGSSWWVHRLHRGARRRHRQGDVPWSARWSARPCDRSEGGGLCRSRDTRVRRVRTWDRRERSCTGRRPRRRGVPLGVGRHRQSSDARRSPAIRRRAHRQGRPDRAGRGRHHLEPEHDSRRSPLTVRDQWLACRYAPR